PAILTAAKEPSTSKKVCPPERGRALKTRVRVEWTLCDCTTSAVQRILSCTPLPNVPRTPCHRERGRMPESNGPSFVQVNPAASGSSHPDHLTKPGRQP